MADYGGRCWSTITPGERFPRRKLLEVAVAVGMACEPVGASAFDNALPEASKYPGKNPGKKPDDLGLKVRKLNRYDESDGPVLKECGYGPNCFSTTGDPDDEALTTLIKPWQIPSGMSPEDALAKLEQVIRNYPPGQQNVDGGGFSIVTAKNKYLYAQFESMKKGKVDDVEFAIGADGSVQIRSGGRTGLKADFGSNAKRLNYLSAQLQSKGWTAPGVDKDSHPYYYTMNAGSTKTQCIGLNCPTNYELIEEEP